MGEIGQLKSEISDQYLENFKQELGWIKSLALLPIEKKVKKILTWEFQLPEKFDEVKEKGFTLVPSRYIEFVNRDENIDFDTKMKSLQSELKELLIAEEKSKEDLLSVFKELGYEIELWYFRKPYSTDWQP